MKENVSTKIGLAFNPNIQNIVKSMPEIVDFVEVPFEMLEHAPKSIEMKTLKPLVLHCASLSIAGDVRANRTTINNVNKWLKATGSEWLGEHLSYITASKESKNLNSIPYADGEPYNIGFTVPPPMNNVSIDAIVRNLQFYEEVIEKPIIIENPPLYFNIPGNEMGQIEFINEVLSRTNVGFLLDLAHYIITSVNMKFDPLKQLKELPLDRVVEVHISGVEEMDGVLWDNHAGIAPDLEWELLKEVLKVVTPKVVTLEYNWDSRMSYDIIKAEISKAKSIIL